VAVVVVLLVLCFSAVAALYLVREWQASTEREQRLEQRLRDARQHEYELRVLVSRIYRERSK
jgi:type II secretory pathway pseudopilin PulG